MKAPSRLLWIIPVALLDISFAPFSDDNLVLLRSVICVYLVAIASQTHMRSGWSLWFLLLVGVSLILNPFLLVQLRSEYWASIYLACGAFLLAHMCLERDAKWTA